MSGSAYARRERLPVRLMPDHDSIAAEVAGRIGALIRGRAGNGHHAVLGLATGSTPVGVYRELIRLHREEGLDFSNAVTFNLDEYFPMRPGSFHSYHRYMREHLFDHVNIPPDQRHIPGATCPRRRWKRTARSTNVASVRRGGSTSRSSGSGVAATSASTSPAPSASLAPGASIWIRSTRADAASDFFGEENVPPQAITMGVATILEAREVVLLATGEHKAAIVRRSVEGEVHADVAATFLQQHPAATVYLDPAAASDLTRIRTPWRVGEVEWTPERETAAVIWLSERTGKSILHLATDDYRANHLAPLTSRHGSAEPLNGQVFNALISKIRGKSRLPRGQEIVVFSPHPDDDVISMGGLLRKLVENGNRVTVAYQTSGNIAVFDHEVRRYLDFLRRAAGVIDLGPRRGSKRRCVPSRTGSRPGSREGWIPRLYSS